jgi:hypothetical protein
LVQSQKCLSCSNFFAATPPPLSILLQTKGQLPFNRTVTDRSNSLFGLVSHLNRVQFFPPPESENLPFS